MCLRRACGIGLILDHKADQDIILSFSANTLDSVSADSYIRWKDPVTGSQGVLGTEALFNDLVYKAGGSTMDNGVEAFRVKSDGRFIVGSGGTGSPESSAFVCGNIHGLPKLPLPTMARSQPV